MISHWLQFGNFNDERKILVGQSLLWNTNVKDPINQFVSDRSASGNPQFRKSETLVTNNSDSLLYILSI